MANIEEAREAVTIFISKALDTEEVRVIGLTKVDDGWSTDVEVYEDSSFLRSLGLPTRVKDRNIYIVKLNDNLEVESYELQGHPATTS